MQSWTVHGFNQWYYTWWRHQMESFSTSLAICAGNSPVNSEFPAQRPVTRSFDVFFDLRPNKRSSKQSRGWWFEASLRSLWRHCSDICKCLIWSIQSYNQPISIICHAERFTFVGNTNTLNQRWCLTHYLLIMCFGFSWHIKPYRGLLGAKPWYILVTVLFNEAPQYDSLQKVSRVLFKTAFFMNMVTEASYVNFCS